MTEDPEQIPDWAKQAVEDLMKRISGVKSGNAEVDKQLDECSRRLHDAMSPVYQKFLYDEHFKHRTKGLVIVECVTNWFSYMLCTAIVGEAKAGMEMATLRYMLRAFNEMAFTALPWQMEQVQDAKRRPH